MAKGSVKGDRLFYSEPSGRKTINAAINILNDMEQRSSDMRPFYEEMTPDFIQSIKSEFSYENPNKWRKISEPWRREKISEGKPENIAKKVADGQIQKYVAQNCLMEQEYVRDPDKTVKVMLTEAISKMGENIQIARFERYSLGE